MLITTTDVPTAANHPAFDDFAEAQCATFYAETMGRPGVPPGIYPTRF
jgi:hypothetical protein